MANVVYQNNSAGMAVAQTSTDGAADVNIASGAVMIDPAQNTVSLPSNANASTTVYVAGFSVKAATGKLYLVNGYNSKGSAQFIQVHDSANIPAEGAIPKIVITAAASANFTINLGEYGRTFQNGIYVVNSSTGPTKTIGSADIWLDAQYL